MNPEQFDTTDEYGKYLHLFGIPYEADDMYLRVGDVEVKGQWIFYLSTFTTSVSSLICRVAPFLFSNAIPFMLVKNASIVAKLNGIWQGIHMVGKVIIIAPPKENSLDEMIKEINLLTTSFKGPVVKYSIRAGKILYANYCKAEQPVGQEASLAKLRYDVPKRRPFTVPKQYRTKKFAPIISCKYVPVKMLSENIKGDIQLGIKIWPLPASQCVIKQARANAPIDKHGRNAYHSLVWQKTVITRLQERVRTARVLDFFKWREDYFLIQEYINGPSLGEVVRGLYKKRKWKEISNDERIMLLRYFVAATALVIDMHAQGIVHRDLAAKNFIVGEDGLMSVIDFELAYDIERNLPNPCFKLGSFGYMSPQQMAEMQPTFADDLYALGALLLMIVTGLSPRIILPEKVDELRVLLPRSGHSETLIQIITGLLQHEPAERLSLVRANEEIEKEIKQYEKIPAEAHTPELEANPQSLKV